VEKIKCLLLLQLCFKFNISTAGPSSTVKNSRFLPEPNPASWSTLVWINTNR